MAAGHVVRVRVAAPPTEARRLCTRLSRGGISAAPDDGVSRAEVMVVTHDTDLAKFRSRAGQLVVVGQPGAPFFAAGPDQGGGPGEPETPFRRLRFILPRNHLRGPAQRRP